MRGLDELINTEDPAWPMVQTWINGARNAVEVLPPQDPDRGEALVAAQVTTHSTMGAIIYETGGLLIDRFGPPAPAQIIARLERRPNRARHGRRARLPVDRR